MKNIKKLKTLLFTAAITLTTSLSVQAATYTVKTGDSLYSIGKVYGTNYINLMKTNNLISHAILPGQKLIVPGDNYTVKSGDSLYLIAKRYEISLYNLRVANNIWDDNIYIGQTLVLPGVNLDSITPTPTTVVTPSVIPYTNEELDLLARLVGAEAENQPYNAKVAVASTVINRVQSDLFPNTIKDVIYEFSYGYYQFTPVQNGWINKTASEESKKAALEALRGADPTNGALFYFDDSATSKWLWSRTVSIKIGNMVYSY